MGWVTALHILSSAVSWQEALRDALMAPKQGLESAIAARTGLQVVAPQDDQLTRQIWEVVERHLPEMTGTLLDVGCYGGWLYPLVRNQAQYHGIDIWAEAVTAAKKLWGDDLFEVRDVYDTEGQWDVVWCTQILHGHSRLYERLLKLARRLVIYASPSIGYPDRLGFPVTERYVSGPHDVIVWRVS